MIVLADYLAQEGLADDGLHQCEECGREVESVCLGREEGEEDWRCQTCHINARRTLTAITEAATPVDLSWTGEIGQALKVERNRRLNLSRWTIMPDSPLSVECQAEWLVYLRVLQAMTRDHATTDTWVWPEEPFLSYSDGERDDPDEPTAEPVMPTPEVPPPPADEPPG